LYVFCYLFALLLYFEADKKLCILLTLLDESFLKLNFDWEIKVQLVMSGKLLRIGRGDEYFWVSSEES
jgi:hypothetical protein